MTMDTRARWLALLVLCLGDLMIVLDGTITTERSLLMARNCDVSAPVALAPRRLRIHT